MTCPLFLVLLFGLNFAQPSRSRSPSPSDLPTSASIPVPATVSVSEYRNRLHSLDTVVSTCLHEISAAHCSAESIGPDLQVNLPQGRRQVRFGWLRSLLDEAGHTDAVVEDGRAAATAKGANHQPGHPAPSFSSSRPGTVKPAQPERKLPILDPPAGVESPASETLADRLREAQDRLRQDDRWAAAIVSAKAPSSTADASSRHTLDSILAAKEYHSATIGRTLKDQMLEKVAGWINSAIAKLVSVGSKSKWIGVTAEIVFVCLACVGLVWLFIRLERLGRSGPAFLRPSFGNGAPSDRDWQLWLKDAHTAAGQAAWREAIHFLYWASISRLESKGLWPADRTRTPREYLALLPAESPQRTELASGLTQLTRSLERTWYAGRPAAEADFLQAERLATGLGASLNTSPDSKGGAR